MELKAGARLRSSVCGAEFVVVRGIKDADVRCGGQTLHPASAEQADKLEIDQLLAEGILIGKRYIDEESGFELLASKAGLGSLTVDGRKMNLKEAKALPASD